MIRAVLRGKIASGNLMFEPRLGLKEKRRSRRGLIPKEIK